MKRRLAVLLVMSNAFASVFVSVAHAEQPTGTACSYATTSEVGLGTETGMLSGGPILQSGTLSCIITFGGSHSSAPVAQASATGIGATYLAPTRVSYPASVPVYLCDRFNDGATTWVYDAASRTWVGLGTTYNPSCRLIRADLAAPDSRDGLCRLTARDDHRAEVPAGVYTGELAGGPIRQAGRLTCSIKVGRSGHSDYADASATSDPTGASPTILAPTEVSYQPMPGSPVYLCDRFIGTDGRVWIFDTSRGGVWIEGATGTCRRLPSASGDVPPAVDHGGPPGPPSGTDQPCALADVGVDESVGRESGLVSGGPIAQNGTIVCTVQHSSLHGHSLGAVWATGTLGVTVLPPTPVSYDTYRYVHLCDKFIDQTGATWLLDASSGTWVPDYYWATCRSAVIVDVPDPLGFGPVDRGCSFASVSDPQLYAPQDAQTGVLYGGPITAGGTITCTIKVNQKLHAVSAVNGASRSATSATAPTVLAPDVVSYILPVGEPVYLCDQFNDGWTTWVLDARTDTWVAAGTVGAECYLVISAGTSDPVFDPIFDLIDTLDAILIEVEKQLDALIVCPALKLLAGNHAGVVLITADGDVYVAGDPFWDCPPYDRPPSAIERADEVSQTQTNVTWSGA